MPVSEITETAKRIAAGSYGVQIQKKYDDEIGELADTINDMSTKIGQAEKMHKESDTTEQLQFLSFFD